MTTNQGILLFVGVGYPTVTLGLLGALSLRRVSCLVATFAILATTAAFVIYPTIH